MEDWRDVRVNEMRRALASAVDTLKIAVASGRLDEPGPDHPGVMCNCDGCRVRAMLAAVEPVLDL